MKEIVRYDTATEEWFRCRGDIQTTVCKCEACGLHYKPSLGHKCKVKRKEQKIHETESC